MLSQYLKNRNGFKFDMNFSWCRSTCAADCSWHWHWRKEACSRPRHTTDPPSLLHVPLHGISYLLALQVHEGQQHEHALHIASASTQRARHVLQHALHIAFASTQRARHVLQHACRHHSGAANCSADLGTNSLLTNYRWVYLSHTCHDVIPANTRQLGR